MYENTFREGSLVKSKNIAVNINTEITVLEHNKTNRYLGVNEANGINYIINKEKEKKKFHCLIRKKQQSKQQLNKAY